MGLMAREWLYVLYASKVCMCMCVHVCVCVCVCALTAVYWSQKCRGKSEAADGTDWPGHLSESFHERRRVGWGRAVLLQQVQETSTRCQETGDLAAASHSCQFHMILFLLHLLAKDFLFNFSRFSHRVIWLLALCWSYVGWGDVHS